MEELCNNNNNCSAGAPPPKKTGLSCSVETSVLPPSGQMFSSAGLLVVIAGGLEA